MPVSNLICTEIFFFDLVRASKLAKLEIVREILFVEARPKWIGRV